MYLEIIAEISVLASVAAVCRRFTNMTQIKYENSILTPIQVVL